MTNPPSPSLDTDSSTPLSVRLDEMVPLDTDRPAREGLPSTFRMRADAHYVESLDAHASDTDVSPRSRIPSQKPPEEAYPGIASAEAASELRRSLATLAECPDLFADGNSELARRMAANLMRAEIWRSTWLVRAAAVLRGEMPVSRKRIGVEALVARALQSVEPERRLRTVVLHRQLTLSNSYIAGDEDLLMCALSGVMMATMRLLEGTSTTVSVIARVDPAGEFAFVVTQDTVTLPPTWSPPSTWSPNVAYDAGFDQSDRFGAVALAMARRIVETYRGRLTVRARDCGSEIHIAIPVVS